MRQTGERTGGTNRMIFRYFPNELYINSCLCLIQYAFGVCRVRVTQEPLRRHVEPQVMLMLLPRVFARIFHRTRSRRDSRLRNAYKRGASGCDAELTLCPFPLRSR